MLYRLSCVAAGLLLALHIQAATPAALQLEGCGLQELMGTSSSARCGRFTVAENPDAPAGKTLRLRVTVVPSLRATPERDAVVILAGGPGQGAHDFYASAAPAFGGMRRDRDILLIDQRGTGDSNSMDCKFDDSTEIETADPQMLQGLARECLNSLPGDPRFYTTSIAVRDLDAVREALGYEQLSLYAISYGTRVAQHYARRYPTRVRAMILDGVVPVEMALGPDIAPRAQQALTAIFDRCAADAACDKAFPKLGEQFNSLRARLTQGALRMQVPDPMTAQLRATTFGLQHLNAAVRLLSYSDETASLLPWLIHEAQTNNHVEPLVAQFLMIQRLTDQQFAYGMHFSVVCSEDAPRWAQEGVTQATLDATYLGPMFMQSMESVCAIWPRGTVDDDFHATSPMPTPVLILSGGNDPVTPSSYGERALKLYPNGRHLIVAGQGHGQMANGCMPRLLAQFITSASARDLAPKCLEPIAAAPFMLSPTGPAP